MLVRNLVSYYWETLAMTKTNNHQIIEQAYNLCIAIENMGDRFIEAQRMASDLLAELDMEINGKSKPTPPQPDA